MTAEKFAAEDWIDRLAEALSRLAEEHESALRKYYGRNPRVNMAFGTRDGRPPALSPDDVRDRYAPPRHSYVFGEEERLSEPKGARASARHTLLSHPALARVVGPVIGPEDFWVEILGNGHLTSSEDVIAGLMARASQHSGDRFRAAASELEAFLAPRGDGVPGDLDVGYDVVLFYGLTLKERIDVAEGMALLPFEEVRAFVDEGLVDKLAPAGAAFHGWRAVGAVVRLFRWRPAFRPTGDLRESGLAPPGRFFPEARIFLELLAVAHAAPVLRLAELSNCIDRSAGRLLGQGRKGPGFYQSWPAHGFGGFEECPALAPVALVEAREAFDNRDGERYAAMAPIIGRLAEALARSGRFGIDDKILDVAIALERMYELDQGEIVFKLRTRAACFLQLGSEDRLRTFKDMGGFYEARSSIVHKPGKSRRKIDKPDAFARGFDVARRSLMKLLRNGPPADWNELVISGSVGNTGKTRDSAGTTEPGYRNRNGQTVVRRTDIPGNDHNQVVYELECGACGHRYGANGSDIWQRKCPKCGGGMPGLDYE